MIYQVHTKEDLEMALSLVRDGDIIDGQFSSIQLNRNKYRIKKKVHFRDITFTNILLNDVTIHDNFSTFDIREGGGLELSDVNFFGKQVEWGYSGRGLSCFVKGYNAKYIVADKCFFIGATMACIHSFDCDYTYLRDCDITMPQPIGFGYGVWLGGSGSARDNILRCKKVDFLGCRHSVGSSEHINHIFVEGCDFRDNVKHVLDRHGKQSVGGGSYTILDNTFHDDNRRAVKVPLPHEDHKVEVRGNVFSKVVGKCVTIEVHEDGVKKEYDDSNLPEQYRSQIIIEDNTYPKA